MKLLTLAAALAALSAPAWAINKCTGADGKLTFQDAPCSLGSTAAHDDLADAKKASEKNTNAPVQSAKMAADNLQAQLEAELKKHPVIPRPVQPSALREDSDGGGAYFWRRYGRGRRR